MTEHPSKRAKFDTPIAMHDLVIRIIVEYLKHDTKQLISFMMISQRFMKLRNIFYSQVYLIETDHSEYAYRYKPYAWNKLYYMRLNFCPNISELGHIHILTLNRLIVGQDLSPLKTVKSLQLEECYHITDDQLFALRHNKHLVIMSCSNIHDVGALRSVRVLEFYDCNGITDFSVLCDVYSLAITRCSTLRTAKGLEKIHKLAITGCNHLSDVSMLGNVHTLSFRECQAITNVSALSTVRKLSIIHCNSIQDYTVLRLKVKQLSLLYYKDGIVTAFGIQPWWLNL